MLRTIDRYIIREMIPPFVLSLAFFIFVFLMTQVLQLSQLVVNYQVGLFEIMVLLFFSAPYFLKYVMPAGVMIAVYISLGRMSGDQEITALKASGFGLARISSPVIFFCTAATILSLFVTAFGAPWASEAFEKRLKRLTAQAAGAAFKERTFITAIDGLVLFIGGRDIREKTLSHVFIKDFRQPSAIVTIIAPSGKYMEDPEKNRILLNLENGTLTTSEKKTMSVHNLKFQNYTLQIDAGNEKSQVSPGGKGKRAMTLFDLARFISENKKSPGPVLWDRMIRFHVMLAFPVSCLLLGFAGFLIGSGSYRRGDKSGKKTGLSLSILVLFYIFYGFGSAMGSSGTIFPAMGIWLGPLFLLGTNLWMIRGLRHIW